MDRRVFVKWLPTFAAVFAGVVTPPTRVGRVFAEGATRRREVAGLDLSEHGDRIGVTDMRTGRTWTIKA